MKTFRSAYSDGQVRRVYSLQWPFLYVVSKIDVKEKLGECTSFFRSRTPTLAGDGRNVVGSIELVTVPKPGTLVGAGRAKRRNRPYLRAEDEQ